MSGARRSLERLIAAVNFEAPIILGNSDDPAVQEAARILLQCARESELSSVRDSDRLPRGEDSRSEAECEASQSGDAEGGASPTLKSTPTRTAK